MITSSLCDYSNAFVYVKGTIAIPNTVAAGTAPNYANKKVLFKNWAPFTNCICEINNIKVDYAQDIGVVMPMYNLKEYYDIYSKTSGSLW